MWISLFIIMQFIGFIVLLKEIKNPVDVDSESGLF